VSGFDELNVNGNASFMLGANTIDSLLVSGDATFAGPVSSVGTLGITGDGTFVQGIDAVGDFTIGGAARLLANATNLGTLTFSGETTLGADVSLIDGADLSFLGMTSVSAPEIRFVGTNAVTFGGGLLSGTGAEASPIRTRLFVDSPLTIFARGAGDADGREFSLIRTDGAGTTRITGELRAIGDATSETGIRLDDNVTLDGTLLVTDGALNIAGDLVIEGDSRIESRAGQGIVIAGDIDSAAGEANGLTLLVDAMGVSDLDEIPVIVLGGDAGASNPLGDLLLNTTVTGGAPESPTLESRRDGVPRVATVLLAGVTLNEDGTFSLGEIPIEGSEDAGTATIRADRFIAGFGEKITALGSLDLQTGALAALGDVSALNDLLIDSGGTVLILLRDRATVRSAEPAPGIESPTRLSELVDPPTDRGTGLVSGGLLTITGDVRTMTDPNAVRPQRAPTFASLAGLVEQTTIVVDGREIRVGAIDAGISIDDLRLGADTFGADLSSDVLLDLFIASAGGITDVVADPAGQDGFNELLNGERGGRFGDGDITNRVDRETLARYGVRTRIAGSRDGWQGVLLYDDREGDTVSANRIWGVNATQFARHVVDAFERDPERFERFRERLAEAIESDGVQGVARVAQEDEVLRDGLDALQGAIDLLERLGLSDREFIRARSLLLAMHVVGDGVSERDTLEVLASWRDTGS